MVVVKGVLGNIEGILGVFSGIRSRCWEESQFVFLFIRSTNFSPTFIRGSRLVSSLFP